MILTLRYHMKTPEGAPMPILDAVAMFYSGKLSKIADDLNKEALAAAKLDHVDLQSIELEATPNGSTVLVIKTAAIYRTKDHD